MDEKKQTLSLWYAKPSERTEPVRVRADRDVKETVRRVAEKLRKAELERKLNQERNAKRKRF